MPEVVRQAVTKRVPNDLPEDSDSALFRQSVGPVRPLRGRRMAAQALPVPPPPPAPSDEAQRFDLALAASIDSSLLETGEELLYLKPGVAPAILRRLRRGQYAVRDEIDLHTMDAPTAADALKHFLDEARRSERLCVKIIHGKGLRSRGRRPVLKALVDRLLRRRADVLAYAPARPQQGGTGATLVLLAARRDRRAGKLIRSRSA